MSKVQIEIPDYRWFRGEWPIRPSDKQLCLVIRKNASKIPVVHQYRESLDDYCLIDIEDCINYYTSGLRYQKRCFTTWEDVERWTTIELPEDVHDQVLAEIEKWFEDE